MGSASWWFLVHLVGFSQELKQAMVDRYDSPNAILAVVFESSMNVSGVVGNQVMFMVINSRRGYASQV